MRRTASITILLVALIFGALAAFLARSWLQSHSERITVKEATTIVVANKPLAFGAPISPGDVRDAPWTADSKPEGSFANAQDLLKDGRRMVLSPFVRDEPIAKSLKASLAWGFSNQLRNNSRWRTEEVRHAYSASGRF